MKRDMDLIRLLLIEIEEKALEPYAGLQGLEVEGFPSSQINYNLDILIKSGMIEGEVQIYFGGESTHFIQGITWLGHDFLDDIRDPDLWAKTKNGANQIKSWSIETIKEIVKGLIKKQVEEYTGVKVP
ncbi:MAG: hypothetical protein FD175_1157 [Beijerinckiaceae bacterium]|nr:MAG: hypothetical protein FD175_1157 [Beijerinckiaceae bacterium]